MCFNIETFFSVVVKLAFDLNYVILFTIVTTKAAFTLIFLYRSEFYVSSYSDVLNDTMMILALSRCEIGLTSTTV